jgi:glycosyltransferase involved in cell wall biosynthesis
VLLVSPCATPGGAERALAGLARRLPEAGVQPLVALLQHGPFESWLEQAGCPFRVLPAGRGRQVHRATAAIVRLARLARTSGAEAVISNMGKGHCYGGPAAALGGVPSIMWQHAIPEANRFERAASLVPASAVVASCDEAVAAQLRLTPSRRVVKIPLGCAIEEIEARQGEGRGIRRALGWEASPLVGIVGRLERGKGQDVFLRAAARVARQRPDVRFVVVGGAVLGWEGPYPAELEALARDLPELAGRVRFAGHQADAYPWFDALDVVVHASYGEPFGLVLVEAMALGRPLVATAAGGPLEIVEDGSSGLLVPPGDPEAMGGAILRILSDPGLAARLGAGARVRSGHFSDKQMAASFAALLDEVVGGGRRLAGVG